MKARVNYVIATWSGSRYNPNRDYLKVHLKRLFELKHNLDQITIVVPLGSDNKEYYDIVDLIPTSFKNEEKVRIIYRPANDRSYGQFIYAYQKYTDQFTHYIIVEDDYVPNIDYFDTYLVDMIEKKNVDYLCGKYAKQTKSDRDRAIQNQGIVKASAFKQMLEKDPNPVFPVMGPEDGTEQLIFSEYFTNNGMRIGDYANEFPIPYWAKTLMYFSEKRGFETIFAPYQCIVKDTLSPHFLNTIKYTKYHRRYDYFLNEMQGYYPNIFKDTPPNGLFIIEEPQIDLYPHNGVEIPKGVFDVVRVNDKLYIKSVFIHPSYHKDDIDMIICERISWENRGENLYMSTENTELCRKLLKHGWINIDLYGVSTLCKNLTQKEYTLSEKSLLANI